MSASSVCSLFVNLLAKATGEPCSPILMSAVHGLCALAQDFRARRERRTANFYRFWNEVPTILLLIIVGMAIAKPF